MEEVQRDNMKSFWNESATEHRLAGAYGGHQSSAVLGAAGERAVSSLPTGQPEMPPSPGLQPLLSAATATVPTCQAAQSLQFAPAATGHGGLRAPEHMLLGHTG